MKILVERLSSTPTHYAFDADSGWWQRHMPPHGDLPRDLDAPIAISLDAHEMGEDLFISGSLEGGLSLECSRCLSRYCHPIHESISLVLEPAGDRIPSDPEAATALARDGMCLGDELETGWYRGAEIELSRYFHELIVLALPVKPLCREECLGLCPRCGADRNTSPCECEEPERSSPFSVLAQLKQDSNG